MTVKEIDRGWKRIQKELKRINKSYVKVGLLSSGESYPSDEGGASLAHVATIHEFGLPSRGIPARPFMRQAYSRNERGIWTLQRKLADNIYAGHMNVREGLNHLGTFFEGKVQEMFRTGKFVPLKPATIKRKKSSVPLIDTGRLSQSIHHEAVLK